MANFPQELHSIVLNKRQLAGGFAPSPPKGRQVPTKQQRRRMWPLRCARRKGGSPAFRQSSMCHRQLIGEIWTRQQSSSPAHRQSCHEGQKHWLGLIGDVAVLQPPDTFGLVPNDATEVLRLYRDNYCDLGDRDLFECDNAATFPASSCSSAAAVTCSTSSGRLLHAACRPDPARNQLRTS